MSSGAYALYIDLAAGSGGGGTGSPPNVPIHRVVPLPHTGRRNQIHFDARRLTLAYDNIIDSSHNDGPDPLIVMVHFVDNGIASTPTTLQLHIGCTEVPIPDRACLAAIVVPPQPAPPQGGPRGALTALVEYDS
jgi:hypothetical protein